MRLPPIRRIFTHSESPGGSRAIGPPIRVREGRPLKAEAFPTAAAIADKAAPAARSRLAGKAIQAGRNRLTAFQQGLKVGFALVHDYYFAIDN